jgi:hypothetical protein
MRCPASLLTMVAAVGLGAGTAAAALPPRAYDELAARAPEVFIGRVVKARAVGMAGVFTHVEAHLKVLDVYRGGVAPGSVEPTRFPLWRKGLPPSGVCYFKRKSIRPGQVYLLFMNEPGQGFLPLAAQGCRVFRLDGPRREAIDRLEKAARRVSLEGPLRSRLLVVYKWARAWLTPRR